MTQRRHHFAVEYCPPSEDGVSRWFRAHKDYAVGIAPIYVRDDRELAFARAYGFFRWAVDTLPRSLVGVRLVERAADAEFGKYTAHAMYTNPQVVPPYMPAREIVQLKTRINEARAGIRLLEHVEREAKDKLLVEAMRRRDDTLDKEREEEPVDKEEYWALETSGWDCPDERNAYGFCVYHDEEDPCHDSCLFCGEPEERK
jgi:hypothetical protein